MKSEFPPQVLTLRELKLQNSNLLTIFRHLKKVIKNESTAAFSHVGREKINSIFPFHSFSSIRKIEKNRIQQTTTYSICFPTAINVFRSWIIRYKASAKMNYVKKRYDKDYKNNYGDNLCCDSLGRLYWTFCGFVQK